MLCRQLYGYSRFFWMGFHGLPSTSALESRQLKNNYNPRPLLHRKGESMRFPGKLAIAVVLVLVFSVVALLVVQAQTPNKPAQFLQIQVTTVKATAVNDYEDFLKKLNAARDKTAGAPAALMYGVNLGGPAFTYYALTTFEKFADREKFPNGRAMLTKVYGEAEANRLLKNEFDANTQRRT